MKKQIFIIFFCGFSLSFASWFEAKPEVAPYIDKIVKANFKQDYDAALAYSSALEKAVPNSPAGCFFYSITLLSKFDDLGQIELVNQSEEKLGQCLNQVTTMGLNVNDLNFWNGLMTFQMAYAININGSVLKSTSMMRSGSKLMKKVGNNSDATAFYSIYAYYIDQMTNWIPFVDDNRSQYLKVLDSAVEGSNYFSALFRTTLIWMNYDKKQYQRSLNLVNGLLIRYPEHRIYNQMLGDMYFRLGKYKEAAKVYEKNLAEYKRIAPYSIRYYSATGNLSRIYQELGNKEKASSNAKTFSDKQYKKVESLMPQSLINDLEKRDLI